MSTIVRLASAASADQTLRAIKSGVPVWRESELPARLRAAGVLALVARVRARRFVVVYESSRFPAPTWAELRGRVTPTSDGSAVSGSLGIARGYWTGPATLAAIGVLTLASSVGYGLLVLALAAGLYWHYRTQDARVAQREEGRFLLERLTLAVGQAAGAQDTPGARP